jgi:hypothetical protein
VVAPVVESMRAIESDMEVESDMEAIMYTVF